MDVDVHIPHRHVDVERDHGLAVMRDQALVGAAEGAVEDAVPYHASVHKQVLRARVGPVDGRQRGQTGDADGSPFIVDVNGIVCERVTHDGAQPVIAGAVGCRGHAEIESGVAVDLELEGSTRVSHREFADGLGYRHRFRAVGLQELEPRRSGTEEVGNRDTGTPRDGCRRHGADRSGVYRDLESLLGGIRS